MKACCHSEDLNAPPSPFTTLKWLFPGTAFVVGAYLIDWLYPANPAAADLSAALGAILLALPIFAAAIKDILKGFLGMGELVALAVLAAMALGDFRTAGVVAFFMLIALVIETKTAQGAHAAIEGLIKLTPTTARRLLPDGSEETLPASRLAPGDRLRIRPGEAVPADGRILLGQTTLNEASITGESLPRDKASGDDVFAGTHNLTGAIEIEVTRVGQETALGRVRELILAAEQTKLPITRIIDQYMRYYTPVILMIGAVVWFFTDDWNRVIALLVMACPCALILATPTAMVAALSAAARHGILVKNVADLEGASRINAAVFDKTGTLTEGLLGVSRLAPLHGISPSELLHAAASAERFSQHPVAVALRSLAHDTGLELHDPDDMRETSGLGVSARLHGHSILCGRAAWLRQQGIHDPALDHAETTESLGYSTLFIARDQTFIGWIGLEDQIRPEAKAVLQDLKTLDVNHLAIVSGDRRSVTQTVAERIGCPDYAAEYLPGQKVDFIRDIKARGYRVAFIGDGVNDAPALAASDTGIAMGAAGNDIAIHSATIALMNNDLHRIPFLIRLSRAARATVYQNLGVGLVFIIGGITLSGANMLTPIIAAIVHNAGSLIVAFNSARLIRTGESDADPTSLLPAAQVPT